MNFAVRLLCHSCRVNEFTDTCTRCKADKCDECEFDHDCDEESGERVMLSKATKVIDLTSPSPAKCSQADFAAVEKVNAFDGPIQPQSSQKYGSDSRDWREIQSVVGVKRKDELKKGSWAGFVHFKSKSDGSWRRTHFYVCEQHADCSVERKMVQTTNFDPDGDGIWRCYESSAKHTEELLIPSHGIHALMKQRMDEALRLYKPKADNLHRGLQQFVADQGLPIEIIPDLKQVRNYITHHSRKALTVSLNTHSQLLQYLRENLVQTKSEYDSIAETREGLWKPIILDYFEIAYVVEDAKTGTKKTKKSIGFIFSCKGMLDNIPKIMEAQDMKLSLMIDGVPKILVNGTSYYLECRDYDAVQR